MASAAGPNVVEDGLVLALDAGNPKNYNVGVSTNWTDKVGGNNGTLYGGTNHNDGPFVGAGYVEFDGTGDYLTTATHASDFNFGTGDFTIEFWINSTQTSRADPFAWNFDYNTTGWGSFILNVSSGRIDWYEGLGIATYATSTGWNDGLWHHLAVSRSGTSLKVFLDGVQIGTTASSSYSYGASDVGVSVGFSTSTGYYLNGQMSNVLILKGTALYTSAFTPPTKPLTAVPNTVLLTCQGNTISDASSSGHTITASGDVTLTKEPFTGAGAVEFDGSGDYLTTANHASDFNFGSSDFTMEFWANSTKTGRIDPIGWNYGFLSAGWAGMILNLSGSGNMAWYENNNSRISGSGSWNDGSWHHIAVTRDGNSVRMFLDGTQVGSTYTTSHSYGAASSGLIIGDLKGILGIGPMDGYISNFRVIKGTALYTSNFTAPSRTLEPIENTVLLTCQGQNNKDYSSSAHAITVNGDAKATIVSSAFEFDGTDDYVQVPNSSALQLGTGDFTIEMWWYMIGSGNCRGFTLGDASDANGMELYVGNSGASLYVYIQNATRITADSVPSFDTWHHYVIERTSGTMKLYIDGVVQSGTYSSSQSLGTGTDGDLRLGVEYYNGGLSFVGDCKISNFKIYKGKGLTASEVQQNYNATKGRYIN